MPLPPRRHKGSVMDTYADTDEELLELCSQMGDVGVGAQQEVRVHRRPAPSQRTTVPMAEPCPPFMRDAHAGAAEEEPGYRRPHKGCRSTCGASASGLSTASMHSDSSLVSGYFLNEGARTRTSSAAFFAPPKPSKPQPFGVMMTRQYRKQVNTPGPGSYTPVYATLGRPSPFS
eukprot:TRINITY_DN28641_c0_g1_i1.p1 TRINITY_DN28641_c0_g1~~TRINITY_DN28641_c0_g1_i1.p1  ORF type:complete len:174 (+),score=47.11 TRINITY_DN28641_c0_g1_i1:58-579(+)